MPNWQASMQQTFEYYEVDPGTWKDIRKLDNIKSSTINRDTDAETLGSATFDVVDSVGECYIRVYLITIQNGITERHPLGTFLAQSPSSKFDGKTRDVSLDAYTPLIELKENMPPLGYSILKDTNIMTMANSLTRGHLRAPVVPATCDEVIHYDYVSDPQDTWMSFLISLIAKAKYGFELDELGRILFAPNQTTASLQPVWTFDDSNSSILYPEVTINHDLFDVPNVVEVIYSQGNGCYYTRVVNDDSSSPVSTVRRGREVVRRVTNPDMIGNPTVEQIDEYAVQTLKELSTVQYTLTYTHGYCPVRLGDCVRLNYKRAGLVDIKARVINQSIKCEPGCPVTETAVYTTKLWR